MRPRSDKLFPVVLAGVWAAWLCVGASIALAGPFAPGHRRVTDGGAPSTLAQVVSTVVLVTICVGLGLLAWWAERRKQPARVTTLPRASSSNDKRKAA
jgi:hypothetical protein